MEDGLYVEEDAGKESKHGREDFLGFRYRVDSRRLLILRLISLLLVLLLFRLFTQFFTIKSDFYIMNFNNLVLKL